MCVLSFEPARNNVSFPKRDTRTPREKCRRDWTHFTLLYPGATPPPMAHNPRNFECPACCQEGVWGWDGTHNTILMVHEAPCTLSLGRGADLSGRCSTPKLGSG